MQEGVKIVAAKSRFLTKLANCASGFGMTAEWIASLGNGHSRQPRLLRAGRNGLSHVGANALRAHCIEVWAALHSQEWLCYLLVAEGFYWV